MTEKEKMLAGPATSAEKAYSLGGKFLCTVSGKERE